MLSGLRSRTLGIVGVVPQSTRHSRIVRIERHELGPRIYLAGLRLHEWHLGLAILLGLAIGAAAGLVRDALPAVLAVAAATWLIAKDWRDILPRHRDTRAWRCIAFRSRCAPSAAPTRFRFSSRPSRR